MQEIGTKAYMTVSEVMGEIALIIKVLIENTTDSNLKCEHGLSLYIEYKNKKVLLDAGSTCAFAENTDKMGVDLEEVDLEEDQDLANHHNRNRKNNSLLHSQQQRLDSNEEDLVHDNSQHNSRHRQKNSQRRDISR